MKLSRPMVKKSLKAISPYKALKKPVVHDDDEGTAEDSASDPSDMSWLITDPDKQKRAAKEYATGGGGRRTPTFWLREGETRRIRVRQPQALAVLWVYNVKLRNGKFEMYTRPPKGQPDLFADELGLRPVFKAVYEIVDIDGYKDKKGQSVKNIPRFWVVGHKLHEQLQMIADTCGGLNRMDLVVRRTGTEQQTSYQAVPQVSSPMSDKVKNAEKLAPKLAEFFRPPTLKEQRGIIPQVAVAQRD